MAFIDYVVAEVSSGNGGAGATSFRREKYVEFGGPDGGNGGVGGRIIFVVQNNLKTLSHLYRKRFYKAQNGAKGGGEKRAGKKGEDLIIPVPPGTLIRDFDTKDILKELMGQEEWVFLKGGQGGKGNSHFKSSTYRTPRFSQEGEKGETRKLIIELNLIADIGFLGFPNAGKSSLLGALTQADPKVGDYAFTTLIPQLGVLKDRYRSIVLADIPGIIEGASEGIGLGLRFLKHIQKTRALAFVLDASEENYMEKYAQLLTEIRLYDEGLLGKKRVILLNKKDQIENPQGFLEEAQKNFPEQRVILSSIYDQRSLEEVQKIFLDLVFET